MNRRGAALPETALIISLVLLLLLGASQMAIIGITQVSADGAAFVAAHTYATDPSANAGTTVASVFPQFSASNVTAGSGGTNLTQGVVTKSVGGFLMLPGAASSYTIRGADVEYDPQGAAATPAPYAFAATATLKNYCPVTGACTLPASYSMYLAQSINTQNTGNGSNGAFAEWRCHQQYFAALAFPATRPTAALKNSTWDPTKSGTTENTIYGWDTGTKCK